MKRVLKVSGFRVSKVAGFQGWIYVLAIIGNKLLVINLFTFFQLLNTQPYRRLLALREFIPNIYCRFQQILDLEDDGLVLGFGEVGDDALFAVFERGIHVVGDLVTKIRGIDDCFTPKTNASSSFFLLSFLDCFWHLHYSDQC